MDNNAKLLLIYLIVSTLILCLHINLLLCFLRNMVTIKIYNKHLYKHGIKQDIN